MCPDYSGRWWRKRGLTTPPDIDSAAFLCKRAEWACTRQGYRSASLVARIILGDASEALPNLDTIGQSSGPYIAPICRDNDLSGRHLVAAVGARRGIDTALDWSTDQKFSNTAKYEAMQLSVMLATRARSRQNAVTCLRVDARERTLSVVRRVMERVLPGFRRYEHSSPSPSRTQTTLYGDRGTKPGDVDLVYLPSARRRDALLKNSVA